MEFVFDVSTGAVDRIPATPTPGPVPRPTPEDDLHEIVTALAAMEGIT